MAIRPFLHFPPPPSDPQARRQYEVLQNMRKGKTENVGEFTCTPSAATTVLSDVRISPQSVIVWHPTTLNAAAELAAGTMYILDSNISNGTATVTHANNAQTDRTFRYAVIG